MSQVSYPCPQCKHPVAIEFRQAGQVVKCQACQSQFDAPKLRDLKSLSPVAVTSSNAPSRRATSTLRNWLFVLGFAMLVIGLVAGWLARQYASTMVVSKDAATRFRQSTSEELDSFSPAQLWQTWDAISDSRLLPDWEVAVPRKVEKVGQGLQAFSYGLFGVAGLGLVLVVSSLVMALSTSQTATTR